ncbi:MAG: PAS domain S-box protein [Candidatus Obscuribacterales bacterium]|nr:PAS domain S-box protein [Candidatus Obscuribacterales bacterium]
MKNWSLTTMTTIAIGVTVLLLIHIGTISLRQCFSRIQDTNLSQQRLTVLMALDSIKYDLAYAIAGEQAYIWSGQPRYYKQYKNGIKRVNSRIEELEVILHGRHRMIKDEIKEYIRVRTECAEEVILLKQKEGSQAAAKRAEELGEEMVTKHIEVMVDELGSQAELEFKVRAREMDRGSMQTVAGITLLMSVALIILLVIVAVVHKYVNERQRAERSLRIAEKRFRAVFNQTFQFSGLLSPEGIVLEANQSALDFAGISLDDVKEKDFWEAPWWSHSEEARTRIKDAVKKAGQGEMVRMEEEVSGKSRQATVDFSVKPIFDEGDKVVFLISEARDITERKLAEQASQERAARMRAIVETAPDGIITINSDGTIESINSALTRLFGYDSDELLGEDVNLILPNLLGGADGKSGTSPIKTGERRVFGIGREFYGIRKDGVEIPVEVALSVIRLEDNQIITGIVRDVTERKDAERRVKEFYSTVSHELRTPLTAIRTALGLIQGKENKPVLDIACEEADRLIRLINDILDIRKIEAGKLDLELKKLSPGTIIERAVGSISSLAEDKGIEICVDIKESDLVLADEDRIQQVLSNLLSNAIKWSPDEGKVYVRTSEAKDRCRFEIEDEGPGVPEEEAHKLFGRFEQVSTRDNREKGGTGLGLAIAKAIVEQHNGFIGIEGAVSENENGNGGGEKGSIFWFEIPLLKE